MHEQSPQSVQVSPVGGIPVPEAVRGLRIEIAENVSYTPVVPKNLRERFTGDGPADAMRKAQR